MSKDRLGAHVDGGGTTFSVHSAHATAVTLCLYDRSGREDRVPMVRSADAAGVWTRRVDGVGTGTRYGYRVEGPYRPADGLRFNDAKLLIDPYCHATSGDLVLHDAIFGHTDGVDSLGDRHHGRTRDDQDSAPYVPRSVVIGPEVTSTGREAATTRPRRRWRDTVIYEMHTKGFSKLNQRIPPELRGTYAGLAHPVSVRYLRQLGVTAVELLPVHQIATEPEVLARGLTNYWGYNPLAFAAVHDGYGSTPDPARTVAEFGEMVASLHDAGLEVLIDVVFNHSSEGAADGPTMSLRGLDNPTYYWLTEPDRSDYLDFTGVGNTLRFGSPVVDDLVVDALHWWAEECGVDGFRFDLASSLGRNTDDPHRVNTASGLLRRIGTDPVLSDLKLIAEPWDIGTNGYQVGNFPPRWTEWNDRFRDTVRDFWRGRSAGVREIATRISGSSDMYADDGRHPTASINFVTAHDGFTLHDLVSYEHKHNLANGENGTDGSDENRSDNHGVEGPTEREDVLARRARTKRAMAGTLLISTGVPMITAGDEFGRSQQGNNNAYAQDNDLSWLDHDLTPAGRDQLLWFTDMLSIREEFPVLRREHFFSGQPTKTGMKDLAWFHPDGHEMTEADWLDDGLRILGAFLHSERPSLLWWLNGSEEPAKVRLPGRTARYRLLADSASGRTRTYETWESGDALAVEGRAFLLLEVS